MWKVVLLTNPNCKAQQRHSYTVKSDPQLLSFTSTVVKASYSPSNQLLALCDCATPNMLARKVTLLKMMFRFGLSNPNNMSARGATLLPCSLFLAISVNNTQSIVCGGLEKHLPRPSGGDPVYLTDASVSNQCLSGIVCRPLLHSHRPQNTHTHIQEESRAGIHHSLHFVRKL